MKAMKIETLSFNSILDWNDEGSIPKIGIIYKGIISIQHKSKRNIEIAHITKGMHLLNQISSLE